MKSAEYKRGYDAGYKQALLDALKQRDPAHHAVLGGPDAPKPPMSSSHDPFASLRKIRA